VALQCTTLYRIPTGRYLFRCLPGCLLNHELQLVIYCFHTLNIWFRSKKSCPNSVKFFFSTFQQISRTFNFLGVLQPGAHAFQILIFGPLRNKNVRDNKILKMFLHSCDNMALSEYVFDDVERAIYSHEHLTYNACTSHNTKK
jgi:hypothetical protein